MASIIDQIFAQSQIGSADGATLGVDSLVAGAQLAQRGRQIREQEKTGALRRQLMQQTISFNDDMNRLKIEEAMFKMEQLKAMRTASTAADALTAQALREPSSLDSPELNAAALELMQTPGLLGMPSGKNLFDTLKSHATMRNLMGQGMKMTSRTVQTPTGPATFETPGPSLADTAALAKKQGLEVSSMSATGQPTFSRPRVGEETIIDPQTGQVTIRRGITGPSDIPTSVRSNAMRDLNQTQKLLTQLQDTQQGLRDEDLGITGVIGESLFDRLLPQFGVGEADLNRMDSRTKLRTLREQALRMVSSDSRFSNVDRQAIERILPQEGFLENIQTANRTIETLQNIFAKRALIDAQDAGVAPPRWALESMDDQALLESVNTGLVDGQLGLEIFDARNPTP